MTSAGSTRRLQSGEDVDLCWRLIEAGARLRYEPIALVAHDHRTELRGLACAQGVLRWLGGSAVGASSRTRRPRW